MMGTLKSCLLPLLQMVIFDTAICKWRTQVERTFGRLKNFKLFGSGGVRLESREFLQDMLAVTCHVVNWQINQCLNREK